MYDLTEFPETRICFLFEAVDKDNKLVSGK